MRLVRQHSKFIVAPDGNIKSCDWKDVGSAIATRVDSACDTLLVCSTPIDYLDFAAPVSGLRSTLGPDATSSWPGRATASGAGL